MPPVKGNRYRKADFGIIFPRTLVSSVEINGEIYFFITIDQRHDDKLHKGGIIHEPNDPQEVVKQVTQVTQTMHTFLRDTGEKDFKYLGLLATIEPFDATHNFLTFK